MQKVESDVQRSGRLLADRHLEAALRECLEGGATNGDSIVSRICEAVEGRFDTCWTRDRADVVIDWLFVHGSRFKKHTGARTEPVLVAYGITPEGTAVLQHLNGTWLFGSSRDQSTDAWGGFLEDMAVAGLAHRC